ncbi:hypothetical protein EVAR_99815_1 [Eumeta japonica]|uniref:Uncharacterized protein n=1 Tax=Eumeta variegata TaxID=151549 RepID=A0A4C2AAK7_EUMVA|nr:hypothetical protein EVAR_99815_1 [Eumeta japonica]
MLVVWKERVRIHPCFGRPPLVCIAACANNSLFAEHTEFNLEANLNKRVRHLKASIDQWNKYKSRPCGAPARGTAARSARARGDESASATACSSARGTSHSSWCAANMSSTSTSWKRGVSPLATYRRPQQSVKALRNL